MVRGGLKRPSGRRALAASQIPLDFACSGDGRVRIPFPTPAEQTQRAETTCKVR